MLPMNDRPIRFRWAIQLFGGCVSMLLLWTHEKNTHSSHAALETTPVGGGVCQGRKAPRQRSKRSVEAFTDAGVEGTPRLRPDL